MVIGGFPVAAVSRELKLAGSGDGADQGLDLVGMRAEILGELVEVRVGDLLKSALVDIRDDLHSHFLQLGRGGTLKLESAFRFLQANLPGRTGDPLLLLVAETLPQLVADP